MSHDRSDGGDRGNYLFWRDEILEAGYWMMNEGIENAVSPGDLTGFLDAPEGLLERTFDRMVEQGLIEAVAGGYDFTDRGEAEAKRRFVEEFGDMQGFGRSHADCGPDCWCHDVDHADEACPSQDDHSHA